MSFNTQCLAAPFEQSPGGCQLGRRAPNQPRPAMMRPRAGTQRHRAAHGRRGLCDAAHASAPSVKTLHKREEACADKFVTDLLQEAVDHEVSWPFVEVDYDSESCDEFVEDYDEVMSLSNSDEESQEDIETQAFQLVAMATNFAKSVVHQGIQRDLSAWSEEDSDAEHDSQAENEIEELRLDARNCLLAAARDGRLDAALKETRERAELEELRQEAKACLLAAFHDGRLEAALNESKQHVELQNLSRDVRETLLEAANDGRLSAALNAFKEREELEALRKEARASIIAAAQDGRLEAALKESSERTELERLRKEVRASLIAAAHDGRLEAALKEAKERAVDELRREARASLVTASQDGRLEAILRASKERTEFEELRQEAVACLLSAAQDGRLEASLKASTDVSELDALPLEPPQSPLTSMQNGQLQAVFEDTQAESEALADAAPQEEQAELGATACKTFSTPALLEISMPLAEKLEQLDRPVSPSNSLKTPGRTKRRVIGGVARSLSAAQLSLQSAMASPVRMSPSASETSFQKPWTMAGSPAGSLRRRQKEPSAQAMYRLDEDSGCEGPTFSRKTSLTSMFDALGSTEVFSLDADEVPKPVQAFSAKSSPKKGLGMAKSSSSSAISAKTAMAMDLGRPSSSSAMSQDLGLADEPTRLRTPSMGSRCSSLGSLPGMEKNRWGGKHANLLPMISKPNNSAAGWSVGHAVSVSKARATRGWGTIGSPVF
eukprot:TRINITY_DN6855_c0_g2_i1.p1 TRINITY_DN6855_c0_g2~~TRINITY_DN6855_c0_g2_i1.p1  ORF type:complete len:728 (-),score=168.07 TRINITY_DN6855_c0_g2_i1:326-2509(-)